MARPVKSSTTRKKVRDEILTEALQIENPSFSDAWRMYQLGVVGCQHVCPAKPTNCRKNPYCLARMGLEKFEKLIKNSEQSHNKLKESVVARDVDSQPCGLVNSGNFCYVNSFLQIFFNDPEFRQIIFDWKPHPQYIPPPPPKMDVQAVMSSLQEIFFHLQTSPFEECEVAKFTSALRLGNEQQDAQEFTLCFFDALDRNLGNHPNGDSTRRRIKQRFQGSITQAINCDCGRRSESTNVVSSLQLSIDGLKTLTEAISRYLYPESLSPVGNDLKITKIPQYGLDDYRCPSCNKMGGVTKTAQFNTIPNALILQLNRYVFDATGRNKKLKTAVQFPRQLSSTVLQPNAPQVMYELCAVMIHEGDNTHCGHYYDVIKRPENGKWYLYNDETVKETKAPGVEKEKSTGVSKPPIDLRACYGLVYRQITPHHPINLPPADVSLMWHNEVRERFDRDSSRQVDAGAKGLSEVKKRHQIICDLIDELEMKPQELSEYVKHPEIVSFLPTDLISDIIMNEYDRVERRKKVVECKENGLPTDLPDSDLDACTSSAPSTPEKSNGFVNGRRSGGRKLVYRVERDGISPLLQEHSISLCSHGKLDIDQFLCGQVRAVNGAAADKLLSRYAIVVNTEDGRERGAPNGHQICVECLELLKREASFKSELAADEKLATKILKEEKLRCSVKNQSPRPEDHVYIARKCLQNFKRLANKEMLYQRRQQENTSVMLFRSRQMPHTSAIPRESRKRSLSREGTEGSESPLQKERKDDSDVEVIGVVNNLVSAFEVKKDESPTANQSTTPDTENTAESSTNSHINGNGARSRSSMSTSSDKDDDMVDFNSELRCPHGGVEMDEFRLSVSPEEWEVLSKNFSKRFKALCSEELCQLCCRESMMKTESFEETCARAMELFRKIPVLRDWEKRSSVKASELGTTYSYAICNRFIQKLKNLSRTSRARRAFEVVEVCQECFLCEKHGHPCIAFNPEILGDNVAFPVPLTSDEWKEVESALVTPATVVVRILPDGRLENFCDECFETKLRIANDKKFIYETSFIYIKIQEDDEPPETCAPSTRGKTAPSTRRTAAKQLIKIRMSSSQTVKEMKLKLYQLTQQSPSDQLLYSAMGGEVLSDECTLEAARILPLNQSNPVLLVVQGTKGTTIVPTEESREIERGFTDTALAH